MADRRVKDEAKRASSLKREADSPDQSYVFPSNSRNELVDQHQTRQRKHQRLQVSPIRANIVSTPDREKRYDRTNDSSSRVELSIDDRCDAPLESTWVFFSIVKCLFFSLVRLAIPDLMKEEQLGLSSEIEISGRLAVYQTLFAAAGPLDWRLPRFPTG